jgi:hypothetical protein
MRLLSVAAIVPLLLTSCDSSSINDPFEDAVGLYELTVFGGRSVPATITCQPGQCTQTFSNGGTIVVHGGTLELDEDGTFVERNEWTETPTGGQPEDVTFVSVGTYDFTGDNEITLFAPAQNGLASRTLDATIEFGGPFVTVHYNEGGQDYEYRRD